MKMCFSRVRLCVTPQMAAHQDPPRPWDSPGKNSGVGCDFLLQWLLASQNEKYLVIVVLLIKSTTPPRKVFYLLKTQT